MAIHVTRRCSSCTRRADLPLVGYGCRGGGRTWLVHLHPRFAGHGEATGRPRRTAAGLLADLISIADAVGSNPVIVGASLGGLTSLLAMGRERPGLGRGWCWSTSSPRWSRPAPNGRKVGDAPCRDRVCLVARAAVAVAEYSPRPGRTIDLDSLRKNLRARLSLVLALGPALHVVDQAEQWRLGGLRLRGPDRACPGDRCPCCSCGRMSDVAPRSRPAFRRRRARHRLRRHRRCRPHGCRRQERRVSVGRARLPRRTRLISEGRRTGRRSGWRRSRRRAGPR